jgi:MFS family permease
MLSLESVLLLVISVLFSSATFSLQPYLTTVVATHVGISGQGMASAIATATVVGTVIAYIASLGLHKFSLNDRLLWAYFLIAGSVVVIISCKVGGSGFGLSCLLSGLVTYRFCVGFISNLSRSLQMSYTPEPLKRLRLLSFMKLATGLGGCLGPLLGYAIIRYYNVIDLIVSICILFVLSATLTVFLKSRSFSNSNPLDARPGLWRSITSQPSSVILLSFTAMIQFIFEAQIYSSVSLFIKINSKNYVELISILFSSNAVLLLILVMPLLFVVDKIFSRRNAILLGSFSSISGIICAPFIRGDLSTIGVALLLTIGEIIVPQLLLESISMNKNRADELSAIATYNIMTSGVGMSIGYWLGGIIPNIFQPSTNAGFWIFVYFVFVVMLYNCRTISPHLDGKYSE